MGHLTFGGGHNAGLVKVAIGRDAESHVGLDIEEGVSRLVPPGLPLEIDEEGRFDDPSPIHVLGRTVEGLGLVDAIEGVIIEEWSLSGGE